MALERPEEARIAGASPELLDPVRGLFLLYPYLGLGTRARHCDWRYPRPTYGVIASRDHLGSPAIHEAAYERARRSGYEVETWLAEGTHAFDQPQEMLLSISPMRRDLALTRQALDRFSGFLTARA